MIELHDKNEILEAKMGTILGTIIEMIEEENLEGAKMIIQFLDDNQQGYQFNLEGKKIESQKRGFFNRIFKR